MLHSEETYQLVERYLNGQMTPSETQAFESRMEMEPELQNLVQMEKGLHKSLVDAKMSEVRGLIHKMAPKTPTITPNNFVRGRIIAGVTSFLILGGAALYWLNSTNPEVSEEIPLERQEETKPQAPILIPSETRKQSAEADPPRRNSATPEPITRYHNTTHPDDIEAEILSEPVIEDRALQVPTLSFEKRTIRVEADVEPTEVYETTIPVLPSPCDGIVISTKIQTLPATNGQATGQILLSPARIKGGTPPYSFSLNGTRFTEDFSLTSLLPGNYKVIAKDGNGCTSVVGEQIVIENEVKLGQLPREKVGLLQGDLWFLPEKTQEMPFVLRIRIAEGREIFSGTYESAEIYNWDGRDSVGNLIEAGTYFYEVDYNDGTQEYGILEVPTE